MLMFLQSGRQILHMRSWTSLNFPRYSLALTPKSKQVTSGILVGVRDYLTEDIKIIKEMGNTQDKSETVRISVWNSGRSFEFYAFCIPDNKPHFF
ncbi:hypothetical protein CDAR_261231 [Caerostris darwini]|uniref:Uncharacterized protein n=1 Tax=Caerostris darwini TaxID=1538125 RepID=A0AAV4WCY2_9ARAC|nr:hypothetical protein CDAR_197301 [Caerostris darwini]GIY80652.1 hypothetical protein CDAR_261231 [Caerostris darwini]